MTLDRVQCLSAETEYALPNCTIRRQGFSFGKALAFFFFVSSRPARLHCPPLAGSIASMRRTRKDRCGRLAVQGCSVACPGWLLPPS